MLARPGGADRGFGRAGGHKVTPFLTRIGLRVMADAFSVSDTPSLKQFDGRPVMGPTSSTTGGAGEGRDVGGQGTAVRFSENTPQRRLLQSNGHGRAAAQAGVVQVSSSQRCRQRSSRPGTGAAQDAGSAVRLHRACDRQSGRRAGRGPWWPIVLEAVKVTSDGREETVRDAVREHAVNRLQRHPRRVGRARAPQPRRRDAGSIIAPSLIFGSSRSAHEEIVQKPPSSRRRFGTKIGSSPERSCAPVARSASRACRGSDCQRSHLQRFGVPETLSHHVEMATGFFCLPGNLRTSLNSR
jgi:hypothetical protein